MSHDALKAPAKNSNHANAPIYEKRSNVFIALLCLIPFVNLVMVFVVGAKGREWAWRNKRWNSVEDFNKVQRNWSLAALGFIVIITAVIAGLLYLLNGSFSVHKETALKVLRQNPQAVELLGEPIELGWTSGKTSTSNGISCAVLTIPVKGSKASGAINFAAAAKGEKWLIVQEILTVGDQRLAIINRPDQDQFMIDLNGCLKD